MAFLTVRNHPQIRSGFPEHDRTVESPSHWGDFKIDLPPVPSGAHTCEKTRNA